ncbi:GrpB family protein [Aliivibrio fischeri]|uniref:GrpB family protein n=1 Tax=Aliivibrio fischeri SR5 TaxID=1088719 RepID=A0AAV3EME8_ALIFS|nr:GrpB family protein [Aliivibrio fischeri]EHN67977.1 hypothetical protein VFSR5_2702 [Aliivibrio fischeri SR5]
MKFFKSDEYQTKCLEQYEYYRSEVLKLLPTARVEHIGASSIPGLISKGDLDIFIGVEVSEISNSILTLEQLGFEEKLNTLRTNELCMMESLSSDVSFQIVSNGSEFESFLHFRDKLRAAPELVSEYNELKRRCTGFSQTDYRKVKSKFITRVLDAV